MVVPGKKRLFYLSWLTLFGMSAMGVLLIIYVQKKDVSETLLGNKSPYLQTAAGIFFGSLSSLLAIALVNGRRFRAVRTFFEEMIHEIDPPFLHIVFYSVCAGIGEEILFRAGIQPLVGIWPTAFIFVLLHGYIHPYNLNLSIYGLFLVVISAGFGYLFKYFGLTAAVLSHIIYDITMFTVLKAAGKRQKEKAGV